MLGAVEQPTRSVEPLKDGILAAEASVPDAPYQINARATYKAKKIVDAGSTENNSPESRQNAKASLQCFQTLEKGVH